MRRSKKASAICSAIAIVVASSAITSAQQTTPTPTPTPTASPNARPCQTDPRFRAFDFWIGEWDVQPTGPNRGPIGRGATSVVEMQLDGCVIQENWLPPGGVPGRSFNIFNSVSGKWEQYWVDARGTITHYIGSFREDGSLVYEADQFRTSNKTRMTFFNQGPNQVRQFGEVSTDGGKTWKATFDLTYVRKK